MLPCLFLLQLQRLGIWLTLFLLTIPQGVRAQETWPPISGSVEVRLVGPVYEAELERQEAEEYRVLNEVPTLLMIGIVILAIVKPGL